MRAFHSPHFLALLMTLMMGNCKANMTGDSWITFLSHRSGGNLLYKMRPDGGEVTPIFGGPLKDMPGLSEGTTLYREPHWTRLSPNGKYFLSWVADTIKPFNPDLDPPPFMIYLGRLDGGPARIVVPNACSEDFAWAPDSRRFAFARSCSLHYPMLGAPNRTHIVIARIDGSAEEVVLDKQGAWAPLDWSPGGRKLLLWYRPSMATGTTSLFEFDLTLALELKDRSPGKDQTDACLKRLSDQAVTIADAHYSPNGETIAVLATSYAAKPGEDFDLKSYRESIKLAVLKSGDSNLQTVVAYPEGLRGPICWSPDGQEILFCRYPEPGDQGEKMDGWNSPGLSIWAIRPDGKGARFITTGWCPSWR